MPKQLTCKTGTYLLSPRLYQGMCHGKVRAVRTESINSHIRNKLNISTLRIAKSMYRKMRFARRFNLWASEPTAKIRVCLTSVLVNR